jgi:hypothetical protein
MNKESIVVRFIDGFIKFAIVFIVFFSFYTFFEFLQFISKFISKENTDNNNNYIVSTNWTENLTDGVVEVKENGVSFFINPKVYKSQYTNENEFIEKLEKLKEKGFNIQGR